MNDRAYSYWENFEAPADFSTTHSTIDFTPPQSNISAEGSYSPAEISSQSGSSIHTSDSSFQAHINRNQTNFVTQQPNTSTPYTVISSNLTHHTTFKYNQPPQRGMTNPLGTIFDKRDTLFSHGRTSQRSNREEEETGEQSNRPGTPLVHVGSQQRHEESEEEEPQDSMMTVLQTMINTLQNLSL